MNEFESLLMQLYAYRSDALKVKEISLRMMELYYEKKEIDKEKEQTSFYKDCV